MERANVNDQGVLCQSPACTRESSNAMASSERAVDSRLRGNDKTRGMDNPPSILARLMIAGVRGYQSTLGPVMGGHCRFTPTCSVYAIDALRTPGAFKGGWLTVRRLLRCQPWGGMGYDPVPERPAGANERPISAGGR